jgi:hypothetical protein
MEGCFLQLANLSWVSSLMHILISLFIVISNNNRCTVYMVGKYTIYLDLKKKSSLKMRARRTLPVFKEKSLEKMAPSI